MAKEQATNYAERLVALRRRLGMTQRDLAQEFLVTPGAIALWETGKRTVPGPVRRLISIYESALKKGLREIEYERKK